MEPSRKRPTPPRVSSITRDRKLDRRLDIVKAVLKSRPSFNVFQVIEASEKIEKYVRGTQ